MNVIKVTNTILRELTNAAIKTTSNPIKPAPVIDALSGLDALACQKLPFVQKNKFSDISAETLEKIKFALQKVAKRADSELVLSDNELKFLAVNFMDLNSQYLPYEVRRASQAFMRFNELDSLTRQKFLNSQAMKMLMEANADKGFRYSCFDFSSDEIDKLDELIKDDFVEYYFKTFLRDGINKAHIGANEILPDFTKRANNLKYGFCCTKEASKFYDLLKDRSCDDIDELSNILFANTRFLDEKELDEIYTIFKKLLSAKTPNGEFIFSATCPSDTSSKMMLSGIENILNARKNNPQAYEQYLNLLDLTEQGKIPPSVIGILAKEGKINDEFVEAVNKFVNGRSEILRFADFETAKAQSKFGDALQIGEKLFYRNKDELVELNLSKEFFEKLFPEIETMALSQGQLGDCYLVSAIYDFIKNPKTKGKLYQMFSQDGDDIIVTIPDAKEFPIRFSKAALEKAKENVNASLGIQMLESAYSQTRALKYGTANKITSIEGGDQLNVYNALFGKNTAELYSVSEYDMTADDIQKTIQKIGKEIQEKKSHVKGLTDSESLLEHALYQQEQDLIQEIANLEALQRSYCEDKNILANIHAKMSPDDLLQKLLDTSLDENLVSIGSKCDLDVADKDKLIYGQHAYSVLRVDKNNRTIDVVNPWNTASYSTISFEQFKYWFDALNIASIS